MIPSTATLIVTLVGCTKPTGRISGVVSWGHGKYDEGDGYVAFVFIMTIDLYL